MRFSKEIILERSKAFIEKVKAKKGNNVIYFKAKEKYYTIDEFEEEVLEGKIKYDVGNFYIVNLDESLEELLKNVGSIEAEIRKLRQLKEKISKELDSTFSTNMAQENECKLVVRSLLNVIEVEFSFGSAEAGAEDHWVHIVIPKGSI